MQVYNEKPDVRREFLGTPLYTEKRKIFFKFLQKNLGNKNNLRKNFKIQNFVVFCHLGIKSSLGGTHWNENNNNNIIYYVSIKKIRRTYRHSHKNYIRIFLL